MATDRERLALERIMDGIVESILEASDEEIEDDVRALGEDPDEAAMRTRKVMLDAVRRFRAERRERARRQFEAESETLERREYDFPDTPEARLDLLVAAVKSQPWLTGMLTVQHRDLRALPDEDVVSYLRQLAELGVLDEL